MRALALDDPGHSRHMDQLDALVTAIKTNLI